MGGGVNLYAYAKNGFKDPHESAAACSDKNAVAWANAYKSNRKPELDGDGWIWMLHGDLE